jgi:hypothetical protein
VIDRRNVMIAVAQWRCCFVGNKDRLDLGLFDTNAGECEL